MQQLVGDMRCFLFRFPLTGDSRRSQVSEGCKERRGCSTTAIMAAPNLTHKTVTGHTLGRQYVVVVAGGVLFNV